MSLASSFDDLVQAEIDSLGPLQAYQKLIAENNALILSGALDNGQEIATKRTAIHCGLMARWAKEQQTEAKYDRPFAVVALGGTGREEMTPCSDTDFAFLFDDTIEGNPFLLHLQHQTIQTSEFRDRHGFGGETLPFNLNDVTDLEEKQLNAFMDMKPVYDPTGLADRVRQVIQDTYDPFKHFLHVSRHWREIWGESTVRAEKLDRFDIKNEGLRSFLGGIWTLAGKRFCHSHEVYEGLHDPRALDAYYFLLRIRAYVHLRRGTQSQPTASGNHEEDILKFEDFVSFGEMLGPEASETERFEFGSEVRKRLLTARRRVDRFTWGVMGNELKKGRSIRPDSTLVFGSGGLREHTLPVGKSNREKSRTALAMLVASQRYELPIDPAELDITFRDAGDWLEPVPELGELFDEVHGSLADSMEFLSQFAGAEDRLFPGYAAFETSLDERVMTEKKSLRGALVRQKLRALESDLAEGKWRLEQALRPDELTDMDYDFSVPIEAAALDSDHLAAVKLALKTKRLPVTPDDLLAREDDSLPLHERFSSGLSGIPIESYYTDSFTDCGFTNKTLEVARFLIENRRAFKERAANDMMDSEQVDQILTSCGHSQSRLRALIVFTCADRTQWEGEQHDPARWFNIRELYAKARMSSASDFDPTEKLANVGYSREELEILKDFGSDFFQGIYRHYAIRMGGYLLRLREDAANADGRSHLPPRVTRISIGASRILGVAAIDHPGIAASISGAFWKLGVGLRQAHLFSAASHGLALDFFHIQPPSEEEIIPESEIKAAVVMAIQERKFISAEDEAALPAVARNVTIKKTTSGLYHLRGETSEDVGALIYVLTCKSFRQLGANIYGLAAHTGKDHSWVSVYLSLPPKFDSGWAENQVESWGQ